MLKQSNVTNVKNKSKWSTIWRREKSSKLYSCESDDGSDSDNDNIPTTDKLHHFVKNETHDM